MGRILNVNVFFILFIFSGLVPTSAIVGAGPCACPNAGNHRGIAPTKDGRCYDHAHLFQSNQSFFDIYQAVIDII
jgi:hypothetical protein